MFLYVTVSLRGDVSFKELCLIVPSAAVKTCPLIRSSRLYYAGKVLPVIVNLKIKWATPCTKVLHTWIGIILYIFLFRWPIIGVFIFEFFQFLSSSCRYCVFSRNGRQMLVFYYGGKSHVFFFFPLCFGARPRCLHKILWHCLISIDIAKI